MDEPIFDVDKRRCAVHLTSDASTPVGSYQNEYAFFLWFDESGEKITKVHEFVDSAYTQGFFAKLTKHMQQKDEMVLDLADQSLRLLELDKRTMFRKQLSSL